MERLKRFLATGVSCFIDLTDPDEAPAYEAYLPFATPDGRRARRTDRERRQHGQDGRHQRGIQLRALPRAGKEG